jgi:hypothetical protein
MQANAFKQEGLSAGASGRVTVVSPQVKTGKTLVWAKCSCKVYFASWNQPLSLIVPLSPCGCPTPEMSGLCVHFVIH